MIIKSMSRSEASFAQLVRYISDGSADRSHNLYRNLFATSDAGVAAAFEENGKLLKARKNGVFMYHEIISITRSGSAPLDRQKQALFEIATAYAEERAPRCLVFGALHDDKESNLHYHLIISSNLKDSARRHRLTRDAFLDIQRRLERRVLADYPELEQAIAINKKADRKKTQKAQELERRTGTLPERDALAAGLRVLFRAVETEAQFRDWIAKSGFSIYVRGKNVGFKHEQSGKRYRLATLGLTPDFVDMTRRIEDGRNRSRSHNQSSR